MATITHNRVSGAAANPDVLVDGPAWDEAHVLSGQIGLSNGGTNADLSATGGAGYVLKQASAGAAITVATLSAGEMASFRGELYAADYGISASNSAAVNDAAFSTLITAIGTGGVRVRLPSGKIQFSATLNLASLTNVIFDGQGGLDLTYSGNFGTVLCFTGTGSGNIINMQHHRGVWWRNVQVVYTSNSFTGTVFNCASSFSTGNASGFENVQVYQITNNLHTAGQCWYLKNNVDVTFRNCYASHATYGWLGLFTSDTGETNMIKLYNCTSIGLTSAAIVNPVIGWSLYSHNFELGDAGVPAGILTTGTFDIKDLYLNACKCADSTANGTWLDFQNNTYNFTMEGGDILAQSGTVTGILFGGTFHSCPKIEGVLFSDLTTGINFNAATTGAIVAGCSFLSVTTPISGASNLDAGSLRIANNPATANGVIGLAYGGTSRSLTDPNADRIMFWDDSASQVDWLSTPAAGIAISGTSIALANDLAAIEGLGSTGLAARTASDTWAQRTITGTSNQITVSNGDGVSGNPTISLTNPAHIYTITSSGVNMNSVADTAFNLGATLPTGYTRYRIQAVMVSHASASLSGVNYALYTATGAGGTAVISPTASTITTASESTNNNAQFIGTSITATLNNATLYFRVTTALGSAATADVSIQIQPLL